MISDWGNSDDFPTFTKYNSTHIINNTTLSNKMSLKLINWKTYHEIISLSLPLMKIIRNSKTFIITS